jgi:hypothetical protein
VAGQAAGDRERIAFVRARVRRRQRGAGPPAMTAPSPASHTSPGAVTAAVRSVLSVPASPLADERLYLGAVSRVLAHEGPGDESHGEPEVGAPPDQRGSPSDLEATWAMVVAGLVAGVVVEDNGRVREDVVPVEARAGHDRLVRTSVAQHPLGHGIRGALTISRDILSPLVGRPRSRPQCPYPDHAPDRLRRSDPLRRRSPSC